MSSKTCWISTAFSTRFSIESLRPACSALLLCVVLLLLVTLGFQARAQSDFPWRSTVWQEDFAAFDSSPYYLGNDSRHDAASGSMLLTPEEAARSGRLFLTRRLPVDYFDMRFRARFGVNAAFNGSGADGIVLVCAAVYDYPPNGGGALDFDGCLGYGVEFDTYQNPDRNDPSPEHVAVLKDRSDNHLHHETLVVPTVEDGGWHDILVRFRNGYVEAWLDGVRRLDHDITAFFPYDGYFGFTSATGSAFNEHRIDDVSLSMPTRRSTDFGLHDVCAPVVIDSVLRVRHNHPVSDAFTVTDAVIRSSTPGVFSLPANPAPFLLTPAIVQDLAVRATVTAPGLYTGILELRGDNGESVIDTLRIEADIPRLRFSPPAADFPLTRPGDSRD
ncbi:MAG: L-type lectin-domain containing protein, partial [Bacteroidota bacterium]|nr:L-type lectin-domain containing protein [Bacteroidota bacterium]